MSLLLKKLKILNQATTQLFWHILGRSLVEEKFSVLFASCEGVNFFNLVIAVLIKFQSVYNLQIKVLAFLDLKKCHLFQSKMLKKSAFWADQGKKITPLLPPFPYSLKRLFQQTLVIGIQKKRERKRELTTGKKGDTI